ncbi:MAG: EcsC family protein [Oscillospiraceae bacterium]|nr:EcsC family protein [Oscillospiraceae bacterium]
MQTQAYEKEWARMLRQERQLLQRRAGRRESRLDAWLADKVPEKLEGALNAAFVKAFALLFEKGTAVIEKTYKLPELAEQYLLDSYVLQERGEAKDLRTFSRRAGGTAALHTAVSGAAGIGLGVLGIGLADVAVFTALLLRNVYEIAMRYGYDYEGDREQAFLLRVIAASLLRGEELYRDDAALNAFISAGRYPEAKSLPALTEEAARALSRELLAMKFLQGIPVLGVLGGAADLLYMGRISEYAELKYRRRFLTDQKRRGEEKHGL